MAETLRPDRDVASPRIASRRKPTFRSAMRCRHFLLLLVLTLPLVATPDKWTAAIDKFTKADATTPPPRGAVVFIGSSSIVKWTSLATDFPDHKVINRGFGGSELADCVFYLDRIAIPYHPRVVVLYAGDNDLHAGKTPEAITADFAAFCQKIHAALPATRIVFIAVKPSPSRWKIREPQEEANALIAAHCAKDPRCAFVDVWKPMLDAKGQPRPELFLADRLHMNPAGYAVWAPLVAPHLR
jgi:lysophospholipase L1-like esterase